MIYVFGDCELNTGTFELHRRSQAVPLEGQVFDVLAYLVEHHDRLVPKEELLDKIWGDRFVTDAALNSRIMAAWSPPCPEHTRYSPSGVRATSRS